MNSTLQTVLTVMGLFFHGNPTVDEVEVILPQLLTAFQNAKSGQAFSVNGVPLAVDGVKGTFGFSWSPGSAPAIAAG